MSVLNLTAQVVAAYLSKNASTPEATTRLIRDVHAQFAAIQGQAQTPGNGAAVPAAPAAKPAVPIDKSVTPDYIVCLEDGAKLKTLKRYLRRFNLTPDQYRAKWGLPADYPMTAASYSKVRSRMAKKLGLGTSAMRGRAARGR